MTLPFPPHSHECTVSLSNGMTLTAATDVWIGAILASLPAATVIQIVKHAETLKMTTLPSLDGDGSQVATTKNIWKKLLKGK